MASAQPRWWLRILSVVLALGVLGGIAEIAIRATVPGAIDETVRSQLRVPADERVDVSLGGSAALHALRGSVGDVTVEISGAPVTEGMLAETVIHVDRAPFDPAAGEITGGEMRMVFAEDQLAQAVRLLVDDELASARVENGRLLVGKVVSILGQDASVVAAMDLAVVEGNVVATPSGLSAPGVDATAEQIVEQAGQWIAPLISEQTACVRDALPRGAVLTGLETADAGELVAAVSLSPTFLSDASQREPGTCETA